VEGEWQQPGIIALYCDASRLFGQQNIPIEMEGREDGLGNPEWRDSLNQSDISFLYCTHLTYMTAPTTILQSSRDARYLGDCASSEPNSRLHLDLLVNPKPPSTWLPIPFLSRRHGKAPPMRRHPKSIAVSSPFIHQKEPGGFHAHNYLPT
jgi:hypothetical protein